MKGQHAQFWMLTVSHFILSLSISPWITPLSYNSEITRYFAMVIHEGGVPYKEVFDHKPLLLYQMASWFHDLGPWGLWLMISLCVWIAALFAYRMMRKYIDEYSILPALFFVFIMHFIALYHTVEESRTISGSMIFIVYFSLMIERAFWRNILIGFLAAAIFLMIPNELFAVAPVAVFSWMYDRKYNQLQLDIQGLIKHLSQQLLGVFLIFVPSGIYLWVHAIIPEFWRDAFVYNFDVYLKQISWADRWAAFRYIFLNFKTLILSAPILLAMIYSLVRFDEIRKNRLFIVAVLITFIQLYNTLKSGMHFYYYLYSFLPLSAIFLFLLLQRFKSNDLVKKSYGVGLGVIGFTILAYAGYRLVHSPGGYRLPSFTHRIQSVTNQRGQLYVFRNTRYMATNTALNIIAPSRYFFTHQWNRRPHYDPDGKIFESILADIESHQTRFIIDFSSHRPLNRQQLQKQWDDYVSSHYIEVDHDPKIGAVLLERIAPNDR